MVSAPCVQQHLIQTDTNTDFRSLSEVLQDCYRWVWDNYYPQVFSRAFLQYILICNIITSHMPPHHGCVCWLIPHRCHHYITAVSISTGEFPCTSILQVWWSLRCIEISGLDTATLIRISIAPTVRIPRAVSRPSLLPRYASSSKGWVNNGPAGPQKPVQYAPTKPEYYDLTVVSWLVYPEAHSSLQEYDLRPYNTSLSLGQYDHFNLCASLGYVSN